MIVLTTSVFITVFVFVSIGIVTCHLIFVINKKDRTYVLFKDMNMR